MSNVCLQCFYKDALTLLRPLPLQEGRKTVILVDVNVNETKGWSWLNQRDRRLSEERKKRSIKSGDLEQRLPDLLLLDNCVISHEHV